MPARLPRRPWFAAATAAGLLALPAGAALAQVPPLPTPPPAPSLPAAPPPPSVVPPAPAPPSVNANYRFTRRCAVRLDIGIHHEKPLRSVRAFLDGRRVRSTGGDEPTWHLRSR